MVEQPIDLGIAEAAQISPTRSGRGGMPDLTTVAAARDLPAHQDRVEIALRESSGDELLPGHRLDFHLDPDPAPLFGEGRSEATVLRIARIHRERKGERTAFAILSQSGFFIETVAFFLQKPLGPTGIVERQQDGLGHERRTGEKETLHRHLVFEAGLPQDRPEIDAPSEGRAHRLEVERRTLEIPDDEMLEARTIPQRLDHARVAACPFRKPFVGLDPIERASAQGEEDGFERGISPVAQPRLRRSPSRIVGMGNEFDAAIGAATIEAIRPQPQRGEQKVGPEIRFIEVRSRLRKPMGGEDGQLLPTLQHRRGHLTAEDAQPRRRQPLERFDKVKTRRERQRRIGTREALVGESHICRGKGRAIVPGDALFQIEQHLAHRRVATLTNEIELRRSRGIGIEVKPQLFQDPVGLAAHKEEGLPIVRELQHAHLRFLHRARQPRSDQVIDRMIGPHLHEQIIPQQLRRQPLEDRLFQIRAVPPEGDRQDRARSIQRDRPCPALRHFSGEETCLGLARRLFAIAPDRDDRARGPSADQVRPQVQVRIAAQERLEEQTGDLALDPVGRGERAEIADGPINRMDKSIALTRELELCDRSEEPCPSEAQPQRRRKEDPAQPEHGAILAQAVALCQT